MLQLAERIKKLRKTKKLSQLIFAERLGVTRAHISKIETGAVGPSEHLIRLICMEFMVNEEWLKEGKGPMFPAWLEEFERVMKEAGKSTALTYGFILGRVRQYHKLIDCLGKEILLFEDPKIQPGEPIIIEILKDIIDKLKEVKPTDITIDLNAPDLDKKKILNSLLSTLDAYFQTIKENKELKGKIDQLESRIENLKKNISNAPIIKGITEKKVM